MGDYYEDYNNAINEIKYILDSLVYTTFDYYQNKHYLFSNNQSESSLAQSIYNDHIFTTIINNMKNRYFIQLSQ